MIDAPPLPVFQQIQQAFTDHIRDPKSAYLPPNAPHVQTIETRRLTIYKDLFFNNIRDFFSAQFPVCYDVLGEKRWHQIIRHFIQHHPAHTPLFHQLGQEFLAFIQQQFEQPQQGLLAQDPPFLLELAHYEWIELDLMTHEAEGFDAVTLDYDLHTRFALSPLAYPLAYEWPVHTISQQHQPNTRPATATTLLVMRQSAQDNDQVIFLQLSPLLYQLLMGLDQSMTLAEILKPLSHQSKENIQSLFIAAQPQLDELIQRKAIRPI